MLYLAEQGRTWGMTTLTESEGPGPWGGQGGGLETPKEWARRAPKIKTKERKEKRKQKREKRRENRREKRKKKRKKKEEREEKRSEKRN